MFLCGIFFTLVFQGTIGQESCKISAVDGQDYCSRRDPLEVCPFDFEKLELPVSYKELEHICHTFYLYYLCFDEHREEFDSTPLTSYALMLSKIEVEVGFLCNEKTATHKAYFKEAKCFKKIKQDWPLISFIIEKNAERMINVYQKISNDKFASSIEHCMRGMQKLQTIRKSLSEECGSDAVRLFQKFLDLSNYKSLYCTDTQYLKTKTATFTVFEAMFTNKIDKKEMLIHPDEIPKHLKTTRKIKIPVGGLYLD